MYQPVLHANHNSLITWGEGLALKNAFETLIQHRKITGLFSQGMGEVKKTKGPKRLELILVSLA